MIETLKADWPGSSWLNWRGKAFDLLTRRLTILRGLKTVRIYGHFLFTLLNETSEFLWIAYPTNCVRSGNLNPWKLNVEAGLERGTLAGGGRKSATSLDEVLWRTSPHCALQTSSLRITSRGHSRANWEQSVILRDAHCGWNKLGVSEGDLWICSSTHPIIWTDAACAGAWESWFANASVLSTDSAALHNIFTPSTQVDLRHWVAWNSRVSEKNFSQLKIF